MTNMRKPQDTWQIVNAITRRGDEPGLIRDWFKQMETWAARHPGKDAEALREWLAVVKPRPFYTANELAVLWPSFKLALGMAKRLEPAPYPSRLRNELEFCGLPYLGGGKLYERKFSNPERYFIVERVAYWRKQMPTQKEFENAIFNR